MNFLLGQSLNTSNVVVIPDTRVSLLPPAPALIKTISPIVTFSTDQVLKPIVTFPLDPSLDLNRDPQVHRTVTDSVYKQTYQEWLYSSDAEDIFRYIKIVGGEPRLVSGSERDNSTRSENIDKKVRFIRDHILSYDRVRKLIEEFIDGTRTNWYDVEKNVFFIKELVLKYIKKKLKALSEEKRKLRR